MQGGGEMAKQSKISIREIREYLLANGPHTTGELVQALGIRSSGQLGRVLATFGEEMGLIRFRQMERGRLRVFWKANPHYNPPTFTKRGGNYA